MSGWELATRTALGACMTHIPSDRTVSVIEYSLNDLTVGETVPEWVFQGSTWYFTPEVYSTFAAKTSVSGETVTALAFTALYLEDWVIESTTKPTNEPKSSPNNDNAVIIFTARSEREVIGLSVSLGLAAALLILSGYCFYYLRKRHTSCTNQHEDAILDGPELEAADEHRPIMLPIQSPDNNANEFHGGEVKQQSTEVSSTPDGNSAPVAPLGAEAAEAPPQRSGVQHETASTLPEDVTLEIPIEELSRQESHVIPRKPVRASSPKSSSKASSWYETQASPISIEETASAHALEYAISSEQVAPPNPSALYNDTTNFELRWLEEEARL